MKYFTYPYRKLIVAVSALGFMGIITGCLDMRVSFESANPEKNSPVVTNTVNSADAVNLDSTLNEMNQ